MAIVIHATEVAQVAAAVSSGAGVLHFWAEWCGPAKQMSAIFAELARANPTITFVEVSSSRPSALPFVRYACPRPRLKC